MTSDKHIILFDGDCGICNKTQMWILKKDKSGRFDIHPYQFFDYKMLGLTEEEVSSSVYLIKNDKKYKKSKAVFEILKSLPGIYGIMGFLLSNPVIVFLSNPFYNIIARNRAKISKFFGLDSCKL